jgi:hypothetical protein
MLFIHQVNSLKLFLCALDYILKSIFYARSEPLLWIAEDFTRNRTANTAMCETFQLFLVKKKTKYPQKAKLWKIKPSIKNALLFPF